MGVVNRTPDMKQMFDDLDRRVSALERSKRVTIPVVQNWTQYPTVPQSGDIFMDAVTGFVYVYCVTGDQVSVGSATITAGAATLTVASATGFRVNDTVSVTYSGTSYLALVTAVTATTVAVTFLTLSPAVAGFSSTPPTGTVPANAAVQAKMWRQLVTAADLIGRVSFTSTSFSGVNSVVGSTTGGTGEVPAIKGYSPYSSR